MGAKRILLCENWGVFYTAGYDVQRHSWGDEYFAHRDWVCEQIGVQVRKGKQDCRIGKDNPVFRCKKLACEACQPLL